jgi:hypothetical protein
MKDVDVEVQYIELISPPADFVQHDHVIGQGIPHRRIEAQGDITATNKPGRCFGVAAGKKRNIMPLADEFLGQERNDTLGASIKLRRHALVKGSNLGNPHWRAPRASFDKRTGTQTEFQINRIRKQSG